MRAVLPLGLLQSAGAGSLRHHSAASSPSVHRRPRLLGSESVVPDPDRLGHGWRPSQPATQRTAAATIPSDSTRATGSQTHTRLRDPSDARSGQKPLPGNFTDGERTRPRTPIPWNGRTFALLLDIVRALGGQPLVVSGPVLGRFTTIGRDGRQTRHGRYAQVHSAIAVYVPLVDFAEHDTSTILGCRALSALTDKGLGPVRQGVRHLLAWRSSARARRDESPAVALPPPTENAGCLARTPRSLGSRNRGRVAVALAARARIGARRVLRCRANLVCC